MNDSDKTKRLPGKRSRLLTPPAGEIPEGEAYARLSVADAKDGFSYEGKPGQTADEAMGTLALHPAMVAAATMRDFNGFKNTVALHGLVNELHAQIEAVNAGDMSRPEAMLVAQAHTLDGIFNTLATRAKANMGGEGAYLAAAEMYLKLALRAQNQSRATIETLGQLKNPSQVAFVKQANIANGPQQVNNGTAPTHAGAGEKEITPNEVLEDRGNERMDTGAAEAASRLNQAMATLGARDRAEDARGQSPSKPQQVQGRHKAIIA